MTTWRGFRLSFSTRMGADAQAIVAPGGFAVDTRQPWPLCYDRGQSEGLAGSLLVWGTSAIFRARVAPDCGEPAPRQQSLVVPRGYPRLHQYNITTYLVWTAMFPAGM